MQVLATFFGCNLLPASLSLCSVLSFHTAPTPSRMIWLGCQGSAGTIFRDRHQEAFGAQLRAWKEAGSQSCDLPFLLETLAQDRGQIQSKPLSWVCPIFWLQLNSLILGRGVL